MRLIWYHVLGACPVRDVFRVCIQAADPDAACLIARDRFAFYRVWSVVQVPAEVPE